MKNKVKTITVFICLSFTFFLTQCQSCKKKDPVTHKIIPNQVLYTVSCGFPFPYFDLDISNSSENSFYYTIKKSDMVGISIAVNIFVIIAATMLMLFLASKKRVRLNRVLIIVVVLVILFDLSLLTPFLPYFINAICMYLYVYPVALINSLFDFLKMDVRNNISPRIYILLLIILIYHAVSLICHIKNKIIVK